jgi:DNA-binding MarR family transcriptional regulator
MSTDTGPGPLLSPRLGYLLKHAQIRMHELNEEALAPFGIDRTSMVARLDALEEKGLVFRHPHAQDRRRNVVELTEAGRDTVRRDTKASERAEATLLAPLADQDGERLRAALQAILARRAAPAE